MTLPRIQQCFLLAWYGPAYCNRRPLLSSQPTNIKRPHSRKSDAQGYSELRLHKLLDMRRALPADWPVMPKTPGIGQNSNREVGALELYDNYDRLSAFLNPRHGSAPAVKRDLTTLASQFIDLNNLLETMKTKQKEIRDTLKNMRESVAAKKKWWKGVNIFSPCEHSLMPPNHISC